MDGFRLNGNIAALRAQRMLDSSSFSLGRSLERLSTGSRINRASDDAAGLAVASLLGAKRRQYIQGVRNLNDSVSALSIADGAMAQLQDILNRQRELAQQAANGSLSSSQRSSLNAEAQRLAEEYQRTIAATSFNGRTLLNASQAGAGVVNAQGGGSNIKLNILHERELTVGTGVYTTRATQTVAVSAGGEFQFLSTDLNSDGINDAIAVSALGNGTSQVTFRIYTIIGGTFTTHSSRVSRRGTTERSATSLSRLMRIPGAISWWEDMIRVELRLAARSSSTLPASQPDTPADRLTERQIMESQDSLKILTGTGWWTRARLAQAAGSVRSRYHRKTRRR